MAKMRITIELDDENHQTQITVDAEEGCKIKIPEFVRYSCQPILQHAASMHQGKLCDCIVDSYSAALSTVRNLNTPHMLSAEQQLKLRQQKYN